MLVRNGLIAAIAIGIAGCGGEPSDPPASAEIAVPEPAKPGDILDTVLAGDHRSDEERARDVFRNPKETLLFFGIEPDMTVVEAYPGGGWYTQVLAPYLKSGGGVLYAASFKSDGASERVLAALDRYQSTYIDKPEIYGEIILSELGGGPVAPEGSADAVVSFRNVHGWQRAGTTAAMFADFYAALKPGGIFGLVQHRADGAETTLDADSGYVLTDDVIALAQAAGFDFDRSSEINANALDTKDHPFGVWTLPPVRRSSEISGETNPDFDHAPYDAIGESDRMTLLFRKPIAADGALFE